MNQSYHFDIILYNHFFIEHFGRKLCAIRPSSHSIDFGEGAFAEHLVAAEVAPELRFDAVPLHRSQPSVGH